MTTTTITITDQKDGSVALEMHSDHVSGTDFSNGVKLASRLVKLAEEVMSESNFHREVE